MVGIDNITLNIDPSSFRHSTCGVQIETLSPGFDRLSRRSLPVRGRGLKRIVPLSQVVIAGSLPVRERGLKQPGRASQDIL